MDKVYISLGFSCQSRFSIDCCTASFGRMPFDWNITTKNFILNYFNEGNKVFDQNIDRAVVFKMPNEKTEGVQIDGCYFWHDYPRAGNLLDGNWQTGSGAVTKKYQRLSSKLRNIIGDRRTRKIFVISNTQHNLKEFARDASDFDEKFGIDSEFLNSLVSCLNRAGVSNYEFVCMVRSMRERTNLNEFRHLNQISLNARYVGQMSLPTSPVISLSTLTAVDPYHFSSLEKALCRSYTNGAHIERDEDASFLVRRKGTEEPWAEARIFMNGLSFVFAPDGAHYKAILTNKGILFSNRTHWDWIG